MSPGRPPTPNRHRAALLIDPTGTAEEAEVGMRFQDGPALRLAGETLG